MGVFVNVLFTISIIGTVMWAYLSYRINKQINKCNTQLTNEEWVNGLLLGVTFGLFAFACGAFAALLCFIYII